MQHEKCATVAQLHSCCTVYESMLPATGYDALTCPRYTPPTFQTVTVDPFGQIYWNFQPNKARLGIYSILFYDLWQKWAANSSKIIMEIT